MSTLIIKGGGGKCELWFDGRTLLVEANIKCEMTPRILFGEKLRKVLAGPKLRMVALFSREDDEGYHFNGMINTDETIEEVSDRLKAFHDMHSTSVREARPEDEALKAWERIMCMTP